jgi:hypothetical protein
MTRQGVLLVLSLVLMMWALLSVRPAYPAQVAAVDPCPVLAVRIEGGHVQTLNCAVFLPALEVRR